MSHGALLTLGIVFLVSTIGFVAAGIAIGADMPNGPLPFYVLAAFTGVVAIACWFQSGRTLTVRLIGLGIFLAFVWYVVEAKTTRAAAGLFAFGLPGAFVAITGRYPGWGRWSHVWEPQPDPPNDE